MNMDEILCRGVESGAADIFLIAGLPLTFKVSNAQRREGARLRPEDTAEYARQLCAMAGREPRCVTGEITDDDFSFANGKARFRANLFHQRGSIAIVIRVIRFGVPTPEEMNIPDEVMALARRGRNKNGLVLVTGSAGSGKSTTLACILNRINQTWDGHILTLEDPVEYVYRHDKCIVSQRELNCDFFSFASALRSALRESPDVILLGEMRDASTIEVAMTAAETGQLLFSTLHTNGVFQSIERIIDSFPPNQQDQIRMQLAAVLRTVISQQLVPDVDGSLIPVFEIMHVNPAIQNKIREGNIYQIVTHIEEGRDEGMRLMDRELVRLYREGRITEETAISYSYKPEYIRKYISAPDAAAPGKKPEAVLKKSRFWD